MQTKGSYVLQVRFSSQARSRPPQGLDAWLKVLDLRGQLTDTSQKFFSQRTSFYDAMPACWKKLSPEDRSSVVQLIDRMYTDATSDGERVWTKSGVLELAKYVELDDVYKMRACYFVAKKDESVVSRVTEEVGETVMEDGNTKVDRYFTYHPSDLLEVYMQDRSNADAQGKLFDHMTNYVAQLHWEEDTDKNPLQPSAFVGDLVISETQRDLLNPKYKQVLTGFILYDTKGKGAVQKVAKRRLDMISGNVASYSRMLNDTKRLKQVVEVNELTAAVAEVSADLAIEKERKKEEREEEMKKKSAKARQKKEKKMQAKRAAMPGVLKLMKAFEKNELDCTAANLSKYKAEQLKSILKFYFGWEKGLQKMSKADLTAKVAELYAKHGAQEHEIEQNDSSGSN